MMKPNEQLPPPPPPYTSYPPPQAQQPYPNATTFPAQPGHGGPNYPQTCPPGPGYPGVIIAPPVVFREHPVSTVCPHCNAGIVTQVTMDTGILPWILCGVLFFTGCTLGCCLIPFCVDSLKDAIHMCPQCRNVIGHYKRV